MTVSMVLVVLVGLLALGLGVWLTAPVGFWLRWATRGVLAGVLVALLTPAGVVDAVQDWVQGWLPWASAASGAPGADWVVHLLSFAGLGALLFHVRRDVPRSALVAGLIGLGLVTEVLQYFVEGRSASVGDLVADAVGVGVGYLVVIGLGRGELGS